VEWKYFWKETSKDTCYEIDFPVCIWSNIQNASLKHTLKTGFSLKMKENANATLFFKLC
jgi:hypothetical protein